MHFPQATSRSFVLGGSLVAAGVSVAALFMMPAAIGSVLSTNFLPHAFCYLNDRQLIALHVGSDTAIWLSYLAISATLVYLVRRTRREIPFSWMFLAFGLFIVACGFTHFMKVVVWKPMYWLAGDVTLVTALASVVTAIALPGLVPQVHAMLGSARLSEERRSELEKTNQEFQRLTVHIINVQDEERRRIARELHDSVGQYLAAIKMSCQVALKESQANRSPKVLGESLDLIDRCTAEVRTMSHLLHLRCSTKWVCRRLFRGWSMDSRSGAASRFVLTFDPISRVCLSRWNWCCSGYFRRVWPIFIGIPRASRQLLQ